MLFIVEQCDTIHDEELDFLDKSGKYIYIYIYTHKKYR